MRKIAAEETAPSAARFSDTRLKFEPGSTRRQIATSSGPGSVYSRWPQAISPPTTMSSTTKSDSAVEAMLRHISP